MKPNINREVAIGLSVLGALLLVLGAVAVWRFSRPKAEAERMLAREEKHEEKREAQHPDATKPLEFPKHEGLKALDDLGHWNAAEKEKKKDVREVPPPPESRKERREQANAAAAAARVTDNDDRYSIAVSPPADPRLPANSGSMVIQVSGGEQADRPPRPLDRYGVDGVPAGPVAEQLPRRDGAGPGMAGADAEAARHHAEKAWERGIRDDHSQANPPAAIDPYAHPHISGGRDDGRLGQGFSNPAANGPPNYAARSDAAQYYNPPPRGYETDNAVHREEFPNRLRPQEPLRNDGTYEVQPNDSYWTISARVYGSGAYFRALAEQNRGKAVRPDRLSPGLVISTPPVAQLEKDYPDLCPRPDRREMVRNRTDAMHGYPTAMSGGGRTYVVQEGDTLSSIARNELGKVSRWAEIYQLNREALGKEYDYLTPGMRLALPLREASPDDRMTRRVDGDGSVH